MTKKTTEQTFEVKYTGMLASTDNVFLHYGYSNWENVSECKMRKLKSGYKTEITLPSDAELNFCFRNGSGEWDNNYGSDYCFTPSCDSSCYSFIEVKEKCAKTSSVDSKKSTAKSCTTKKPATLKTTPSTIKAKVATKTVTKKEK